MMIKLKLFLIIGSGMALITQQAAVAATTAKVQAAEKKQAAFRLAKILKDSGGVLGGSVGRCGIPKTRITKEVEDICKTPARHAMKFNVGTNRHMQNIMEEKFDSVKGDVEQFCIATARDNQGKKEGDCLTVTFQCKFAVLPEIAPPCSGPGYSVGPNGDCRYDGSDTAAEDEGSGRERTAE